MPPHSYGLPLEAEQAVAKNFTHAFSQITCNGCRPSSSRSEAWATEPRNPRTCLQMDSSSDCKLDWPHGESCSMSGPQTWQAYRALGKTKVRTSYIMACSMSRTPCSMATGRTSRQAASMLPHMRREANDILIVLFIHMPK
jgi:hypothetical protein